MTGGLVLAVAVSVAGGLGAALRHTLDALVEQWVGSSATDGRWGTFAVNVSGSFGLGLVVGLAPAHPWGDVLGLGLLGGYTTFSTAMLQVVQGSGEGGAVRWMRGGLLAASMLLACVAAATFGVLVVGLVGTGR